MLGFSIQLDSNMDDYAKTVKHMERLILAKARDHANTPLQTRDGVTQQARDTNRPIMWHTLALIPC